MEDRGLRLAVFVSLVLSTNAGVGQETIRPLPQGSGLSARYPGDRGIDKDPQVVFVENFEQASFDQTQRRWESVSNESLMSLSEDRPGASAGGQSLLVRHVGGKSSGGHLYRRLEPGFDKLFVRFYVKFDADCAPIHHFFHVGGYRPSTPYAQGGAGDRPKGGERFSVGIEPFGDAWKWDYYAYWMEMGGSPPRGQTWGNNFLGSTQPPVVRNEWICMEAMIALNDPGDSNGQMALWMNGKRLSHLGKGFPKGKWIFDKFLPSEGGESVRWNDAKKEREHYTVPSEGKPFGGFRWRSDPRLKINFLWLLVYITKAPPDHVSKIWLDDIVVARQYIGPLADPRAAKTK